MAFGLQHFRQQAEVLAPNDGRRSKTRGMQTRGEGLAEAEAEPNTLISTRCVQQLWPFASLSDAQAGKVARLFVRSHVAEGVKLVSQVGGSSWDSFGVTHTLYVTLSTVSHLAEALLTTPT
jgi:hypothetical protein